MAAFSASRLVWSAMSSMMPTILPMSFDALPMEPIMVDSSSPRVVAIFAASADTSSTTRTLASMDWIDAAISSMVDEVSSTEVSRLVEFFATSSIEAPISWIDDEVWSTLTASAWDDLATLSIWAAISTMVDRVSSAEALWVSAPLVIWAEETEISLAAWATAWAASFTRPIISRMFSDMSRIARLKRSASERGSICWRRSPVAMAPAKSAICRRYPSMLFIDNSRRPISSW